MAPSSSSIPFDGYLMHCSSFCCSCCCCCFDGRLSQTTIRTKKVAVVERWSLFTGHLFTKIQKMYLKRIIWRLSQSNHTRKKWLLLKCGRCSRVINAPNSKSGPLKDYLTANSVKPGIEKNSGVLKGNHFWYTSPKVDLKMVVLIWRWL